MDNTVYIKEDDKLDISLLDFLAQLLYKWKRLLIVMVVGIAIALALWNYAKAHMQVQRITMKHVNLLRETLPSDKAEHAEYLYSQYLSYKKYQKSLQEYLADSLYSDNDYAGNMSFTALYFVDSKIDKVNQVFARLAVGNKEYEKIAEILNKDKTMLDDVYRRVSISDLSTAIGEDMNLSVGVGDETEQKKTLLQVYIVTENQEQADAIKDVIEGAFQVQLKALEKIDPQITLTEVGSKYSTDISGFLINRQTSVTSNLNAVNDQLNNLQTNYVEKLDGDEREYYNLLKNKGEQEITPPKKPSLLKYVVIGAFLGIFLFCCAAAVIYIFNGKIKTTDEIIRRYHLNVTGTIFRKRKGLQPFGGIARWIGGIDLSDEAVRMSMIVSDFGISLEKMGLSTAYLICDENTQWQKEVSAELQRYLNERKKPIRVIVGNPLSSPQELENFSEAEAVLVLVQLKNTSRTGMDKWIQLCGRYELPVVGTAAIEEC